MTSRCLSNAYMLESRTGFQAFGIAIRCGGSVAYRDLRDFVRKLEKEGELKRVRTEVDPNLEITEIVQRVGRDRKHALAGSAGKRTQSEKAWAPDGFGPGAVFIKVCRSAVPLLLNTI